MPLYNCRYYAVAVAGETQFHGSCSVSQVTVYNCHSTLLLSLTKLGIAGVKQACPPVNGQIEDQFLQV